MSHRSDEMKDIVIARNEKEWLVVYLIKDEGVNYFPICFRKVHREIEETEASMILNIAAKEEGAAVFIAQQVQEGFFLLSFVFLEGKWRVEKCVKYQKIL